MYNNTIMKKLTLAIIGCGYWGPNFVRNFFQAKGVRVKYACDLNQERLAHIKELYPSIHTTRDYRQVLKDPGVEAVVVSTPAQSHYSIARDCLTYDKHVLVEKPIAMNVAEARSLVTLSRKKRRVLMVGHTFKFNPAIAKLKELIESGALGRICYIYSRRTNLGPLRKDVNAMWDLAPHDVSIISYLLNSQPLDVTARGKKFLEHNLEDVAFLTMSYPSNIFVHVHVSWLDPRKVREIIIVGNRKMAVFDDLDTKEPIKVYDKAVVKKRFGKHYDSFREFQMIIKSGKTAAPRVRLQEPLKLECAHFLECVRKNKTPLTDGKDGLAVLTVMRALQESLEKDGALIKLQKG